MNLGSYILPLNSKCLFDISKALLLSSSYIYKNNNYERKLSKYKCKYLAENCPNLRLKQIFQGGPSALPTLQEGVVVNLSPPKEENTMYAQGDPLRGVVTPREPQPREERRGLVKEEEQSQREGSIFLIDLEETKCNDGKTQLKPKSKKFSASSLLSSKITQSWFFRK